MAHREDDGFAHLPSAARPRVLGGNRRCSLLYGASALGIPVSTTHTITGAIVGVGSTRGKRAVRWSVAGTVVWAWILTIPASALVSRRPIGSSPDS
jgi:hypothetical protein